MIEYISKFSVMKYFEIPKLFISIIQGTVSDLMYHSTNTGRCLR